MRKQILKKLSAGETSFILVRQFRNMFWADDCNLSVTEGFSNAETDILDENLSIVCTT